MSTPGGGFGPAMKNFAGDPFVIGDTLHCPFCGQFLVIDTVEPDGKSFLPVHNYPTKVELRAMTRERRRV